MAPIKRSAAINSIALNSMPRNGSFLLLFSAMAPNTVSNSTDPKTKKIVITPSARPTSPTRFVTKALIAAALADGFL